MVQSFQTLIFIWIWGSIKVPHHFRRQRISVPLKKTPERWTSGARCSAACHRAGDGTLGEQGDAAIQALWHGMHSAPPETSWEVTRVPRTLYGDLGDGKSTISNGKIWENMGKYGTFPINGWFFRAWFLCPNFAHHPTKKGISSADICFGDVKPIPKKGHLPTPEWWGN